VPAVASRLLAGRRMPRVAYVMPLPPGAHPGMDALAHGIAAELGRGLELRVLPADLRHGSIDAAQSAAFDTAREAGVAGVILFVLDPLAAEDAAARLRAAAVPLVAIHPPRFPVDAAVVVPNYHHGTALARRLSRELPRGARVGIVGGPEIVDDLELVDGLVAGCRRSGLEPANDPFDPAFRNLDDVAEGAAAAVRAVLDHHPAIEGLVVFNDETLLGAWSLLERRGWPAGRPIVCRNGGPAAVDLVRRGRLLATYDYLLPEMGRLAGRMLSRLLHGEVLGNPLESPGFGQLVDASNAAQHRPWSERAYPVELTAGLS